MGNTLGWRGSGKMSGSCLRIILETVSFLFLQHFFSFYYREPRGVGLSRFLGELMRRRSVRIESWESGLLLCSVLLFSSSLLFTSIFALLLCWRQRVEFVLSGSFLRCSDYTMSPCVTGYSRLGERGKDNSCVCSFLCFIILCLFFLFLSCEASWECGWEGSDMNNESGFARVRVCRALEFSTRPWVLQFHGKLNQRVVRV
ncbi:hypothetical protein V8C44DRAFT_204428 [Trichoderma aethiopicum]